MGSLNSKLWLSNMARNNAAKAINTGFIKAQKIAFLLCCASTMLVRSPAMAKGDLQMLFPSAATGSALALSTGNPNTSKSFGFDYKAKAQAKTEEKLNFWTIDATPITYSSGQIGYTARLHLYASGGVQRFNWKTQLGHLSSAADVKNQEFTVYVRVRELSAISSFARISLKIRGGKHSEIDTEASSCVMMNFGPGGVFGTTSFAKELTHPIYDGVKLSPLINTQLTENQWTGLKYVSYTPPNKPEQVINRLYIDTTAFNSDGKPSNQWRLLSEYIDEAGKSTGRYNTLVNWGGWQTTLRMDGYKYLDFVFPSVREVTPPVAP
jgi:hypothetical protein